MPKTYLQEYLGRHILDAVELGQCERCGQDYATYEDEDGTVVTACVNSSGCKVFKLKKEILEATYWIG